MAQLAGITFFGY